MAQDTPVPPMLALTGYLIADLAVRMLPPRVADGLAVAIARLAFALHLPARHRLEANLARLPAPGDPRLPRRTAREAFEHFALALVDFLRLARLPREALDASVEVRGREHLEGALASGRGVILLSAHLGNWEWGAAYLAARGTRVHLVARPHPSAAVEAFFARRRRAWGVVTLPGRPLWVRAARALRRREWVALMGDRGGRSAASSCAWAATLALRTGALVLPAVMVRLDRGRYAACFEPLLSPEQCRDGGYRAAVQRYLERYPGQWCAFESLPAGLA